MARVLSHPATVPGSAPRSSWKAKRTAPRMLYRVPTASLRPSGFSGLRSSNCLDALTRYGGVFHSAVVTGVGMSPRQRKANRFVLRAMFERFTEKAIKVVMNAQEEARRLGHNYVGTEQILLGLIGEGTGIAAKVLKSMGINQKEAWIEVEKIIGRGSGFLALEIPFTPCAKRVFELSLEEARQLGHSYIGSEHLLLGLLRKGEGVAARVLENLGADPSNIRTQVIHMVDRSTENVGISDDVFDGVIELENRVRQIVMERAEAVRKAEELRDLEIYLGNQTADILEKVKEMSLNIYGGDFHSAVVTGVGMSPRQRKANQFVPSSKFGRFGRFGRLNEKAIKVLILAHEEARGLGHNFIDTEHILLGLISEGTGVGAKFLKSMGINLKDARAEVEKLIGRGGEVVAVEPPFTPRARRVLDLLGEEARQLGVNYIEPEHLLLCLLREGEGVAVRVLENLGADPSDIRTQVVRLVDRSSENVRISDNDFERVLELEDRVRQIGIARVEASIKDKELSAEEAYLKSQIADIWEKGKEMNKGESTDK